ncbi:MAG TPA: hypothetical protein VFG76_04150 [Candidatus Polarisedimenticolia bacterium]|nr:hypothetical protein [Candidatus Polarisedimenticolia bacterium]
MRRPLLTAAGLLVLYACAPSVNSANVAIETYISAVSLNDVERVLALSAPYQREILSAQDAPAREAIRKRYEASIEQAYMSWEEAKRAGVLSTDPLGVAIIRAIGLGKEGAASMPMTVTFEDDNRRAIVTSRGITNYEGIRWASIPTGGRMYLLGYPFGKVVNYATGYEDPSNLQLLATVDLQWTLVTLPELDTGQKGSSGWYIETLQALPETATAWSPPSRPPH